MIMTEKVIQADRANVLGQAEKQQSVGAPQ